MRTCSSPRCLPMAACASTGRTSSPWRGGRARCRTRSGGRSSCAIRGVRGSGMNLYFMGGGMEAVYLDMTDHPLGFLNFAPADPARRAMFSARSRLKAGGEAKVAAPVNEEELYDRG